MPPAVSFLFGIHNHQPVGNFEEVFEEAYRKSYAPFVNVMMNHPSVKWNLHCTGILWEWLEKKHPDYLEKVRAMVERDQLELLSGGFYEPILPILPEQDKIGQIQKLNAYLEKRFRLKPQGMWCAERVWEPHLPKTIREANIRYTVLDDTHFLYAGLSKNHLNGYYKVEEQNYAIDIFPISKDLRYTMPFSKPEESIELMRHCPAGQGGGRPALVMADDGEKFGLWPGTHKLVYQEGWLENFLTLLEKNSDWVKTETFSGYIKDNKAAGKIFLPTASYFEMSEWSLPAESAETFEGAMQTFTKQPELSFMQRFVQGGTWRNFLVKYPESNSMYKKMLRVSQKAHECSAQLEENEKHKNKPDQTKQVRQALDHLWAGQCNCSYWHGVFGGLYLPHLRQAIYKNLIQAETILDSVMISQKSPKNQGQRKGSAKIEMVDFYADGKEKIIIETPAQNLYLDPEQGGTIFEWDFKPAAVNLENVLTRRPELYHKKLKETLNKTVAKENSETHSIHHSVQVKGDLSENNISYDWYRRASLIDHFLHPSTDSESFKNGQYGEQGDFVLGNYQYEIPENGAKTGKPDAVRLYRNGYLWDENHKKSLSVEKNLTVTDPDAGRNPPPELNERKALLQIVYRLTNTSGGPLERLWFAPEFNFAFSVFDKNQAAPFSNRQHWECSDPHLFWKLKIDFSHPADAWIFPLETVSNSETGIEKTFQGTVFVPHWKLALAGGQSLERVLTVTIEKT